MPTLKAQSQTQSAQPINNTLVWLFALISFLGFLDSTFLTAEHYLGSLLKCPIFGGCDIVTTSPYSVVLGIPVALGGAIYYLMILVLSIACLDSGQKRIIKFASYLTPLGFIASLWFLYLQLFVIRALCFYCLLSVATSTLLFVLGIVILNRKN